MTDNLRAKRVRLIRLLGMYKQWRRIPNVQCPQFVKGTTAGDEQQSPVVPLKCVRGPVAVWDDHSRELESLRIGDAKNADAGFLEVATRVNDMHAIESHICKRGTDLYRAITRLSHHGGLTVALDHLEDRVAHEAVLGVLVF